METEDIRHLSGKAQLPLQTTSAVVKIPFGAHPSSVYPFYTFDALHIQSYLKMNFEEYRRKFIDVKTNAEYLENAGGAEMILNILL